MVGIGEWSSWVEVEKGEIRKDWRRWRERKEGLERGRIGGDGGLC